MFLALGVQFGVQNSVPSSASDLSKSGRWSGAKWRSPGCRPSRGYVLVELNQAIAPAFRALPEREQTILRLRFHHDLKQSEIAKVVGVSQMQVSRLLKRSIESLSAAAASPSDPDPRVHDSTSLL